MLCLARASKLLSVAGSRRFKFRDRASPSTLGSLNARARAADRIGGRLAEEEMEFMNRYFRAAAASAPLLDFEQLQQQCHDQRLGQFPHAGAAIITIEYDLRGIGDRHLAGR